MDISEIISKLKDQANKDGKIILNGTFLSTTVLGLIRTAFGLSDKDFLTIDGIKVADIPSASGDSVTISKGNISVLGLKDLSLQLTLTAGDPINFILEVAMEDSWNFGKSFDALDIFPFNLFTFSKTHFVYSTSAKKNYPLWSKKKEGKLNLVEGLNFGTYVSLSNVGVIGSLLGNQAPKDSVKFYGGISSDTQYAYPVLDISADFSEISSFDLVQNLPLKDLALNLQIQKPDDVGYQPLSFGITSHNDQMEFSFLLDQSASEVSISGKPLSKYSASLEDLADSTLGKAVLPSGTNFSDFAPSPVSDAFKEIVLNGFDINFDLSSKSVSNISFSISQKKNSTIDLGLFKLESFGLSASWVNPSKAGSIATVNVNAKGKPPVLSGLAGDFSFNLKVTNQPKWSIDTISATYTGSVTIADLVHAVDSDADVPSFLDDLEFTKFLVKSTGSGETFTCACRGDLAVSVLNENFAADFVLTFKKTKQGTTYDFQTQFAINNLTFTLDIALGKSAGGTDLTVNGVANYASTNVDVDFNFTLEEKKTTSPPTSTFTGKAVYNGKNPPKLSDFLLAVSNSLGIDVNLPDEINFDAELDSFAVDIKQETGKPTLIDMAGDFGLQIDGTDWNLYFAYTNNTQFNGKQATVPPTDKNAYVFGVAISGALDLSNLPLVGDIPGISTLNIKKLGFYYTNAVFSATDKQLAFVVPALAGGTDLGPGTNAKLSQKGFNLLAVFGSNSDVLGNLSLLTNTDSSPSLLTAGGHANSSAAAFNKKQAVPQDPINWIELNKTFGPVGIQKLGFSYNKPPDPDSQLGEVGIYLSGTFQIAGLTMALNGLGISFPIPKPGASISFNPLNDLSFHLNGLFLNYQTPSFQIGGGFITLPGGSANFIGEFIVHFGEYGLQAYGGFSNELPDPSLFIFLHLEAPIGGPPFFFITGVSGGFGVNRGFKLPTFDQLTSYPLLPTNNTVPTVADLGGDPSQQLAAMTQALANLANYIPVSEGEYWFAVGLDVTSFKMINVSAVLSVAFGVDFQIGIVGNANMTFPLEEADETGAPPLAYISIDFLVSYSSSSGLLQAFGKLTPDSYVYATFVHVSGGFAFMTWFSGEQEGDFLVTLGGYNPNFKKPSYYPSIPRLQMKFGIDSLSVVGEAYFALTPAMMMAGFGITANWSMGLIQASFDAGLDFILNWKPFHYFADGYIHIAVSLVIHVWFVRVRITIHVGVDLQVWGPEFGGKATVDLDIVSFTINFGAGQTSKDVTWADVQQLIPTKTASATGGTTQQLEAAAPESLQTNVTVAATKGLLKELSGTDADQGLDWIIDPNHFEFTTGTSIPCTDATIHYEKEGNGDTVSPSTIDLSEYVTASGFKYVDPDPTKMKDSVKSLIGEESYPLFAYAPPDSGQSWNDQNFGVAPLDVAAIKSVHNVEITQEGAPVSDLIYVLQTKNVPQSLWSTNGSGQADKGLSSDTQVINNALTGFKIEPAYFFPEQTSYIPYYYLVFNINNLFLYADAGSVEKAPTFKEADYTPQEEEDIYTNMQNGSLFGDGASGTKGARKDVVADLRGVGFSHLKQIRAARMNTENYVDQPVLCYMSDTSETNFQN